MADDHALFHGSTATGFAYCCITRCCTPSDSGNDEICGSGGGTGNEQNGCAMRLNKNGGMHCKDSPHTHRQAMNGSEGESDSPERGDMPVAEKWPVVG